MNTLREKAIEMIQASVTEAATKDHQRNYEKLHVLRNGTVSWFESINKSDDIIDQHADGFAAIPSVVTVGTGGYGCNCDHCNEIGKTIDGEVVTAEDAIYNCVSDSDLSGLDSRMVDAVDEIEIGYFDDEEVA
jgi:hypothetical protein